MSLAEVQVYAVPPAPDAEAPLQWLDAGDEGLAPSAGLGARRACLPFSFQVLCLALHELLTPKQSAGRLSELACTL